MASVITPGESAFSEVFPEEPSRERRHPLAILDWDDRVLRKASAQLGSAHSQTRPDVSTALLLENYPYLRSQIREVRDSLSPEYCAKLVKGPETVGSCPRVYRFCVDALAKNDRSDPGQPSMATSGLTTENLAVFFRSAARREAPLTLAELWAIPLLLKLALLDGLAQAADALANPEHPAFDEKVMRTVAQFRSLERVRWKDLVDAISELHRVMAEDPSGVFTQMDFDTRSTYLRTVEEIAAYNCEDEPEVARLAIQLAAEANSRDGDPRKSHVGYYLVGEGVALLRRRGHYQAPAGVIVREFAARHPNSLYLGMIAILTAAFTVAAANLIPAAPWWLLALLVIPLSQTAVSLANLAINAFLTPRKLPSLDFSRGIPDAYRTFVVVPTLLLSKGNVQRLLEHLEIHYLANRDPNLAFALLTDLADSHSCDSDRELLDLCVQGIRRLNQKHARFGKSPFYLFHRPRVWCEGQQVWMGRERKRGKIEDFNRLLLGRENAFSLIEGDCSLLESIRFVITLDSDTQLPRDAARKLAGILAHPLNRAVLDPATRLVRQGYSIVQPRVSISLESTSKSRLARTLGGQAGLDVYTTAVSDVYQDLYGRATYSGKGIYDVRAFQTAVDHRFPDNTLLSHDLIEGEYSGVGLASNVELIDDYPSTYESFCKRKHRWIRGDWQILGWLLPWVAAQDRQWNRNPLPLLSRWKIFDNLRRSLFEISLLAFLAAGWIVEPRFPTTIVSIAAGTLLLPLFVQLAISLVHPPPLRFLRGYLHELAYTLVHGVVEVLLTMAFLVHQAALSADAILRTLLRLFVTRRHLLEWEAMAQSEEHSTKRLGLLRWYSILSAAAATVLAVALKSGALKHDPLLPSALLAAWIIAPVIVVFMNLPPSAARRERQGDRQLLRKIALLTWRYFADLSRAEDHWIVPDNIQEDPEALARRTSPTNMGLQLTGTLAAHDFGYITLPELSSRLGNLFTSLDKLERSRGHFYNWYDTETLKPIAPRFLSTVDSGNLCAALLTLKQGSDDVTRQPIADVSLLEGLRDHCLQLRDSLPFSVKSAALMRVLAGLIRQLECQPTDLFFWISLLRDVRTMAASLSEHVGWACECLRSSNPKVAAELEYWQHALQARVNRAHDHLCSLAPWLSNVYEGELRVRGLTREFASLMGSLSSVPSLRDLPAAYDRIQAALERVREDQPALIPAFRELLRKLGTELEPARNECLRLLSDFDRYATNASQIALEAEFSFLVDERQNLLRIGYDAEAETVAEPCYDLLASEARTAVFLAIAKGDAPCDVWFRLGRQVTCYRGWKTLVSWSGTMFEYLMPSLFMKTFHRTLLHQSLTAVVKIQHLYGRESGVPWGISESAFSARDSAHNYQYRAFGVPVIKLDGAVTGRLVIAPYATMLALMVEPQAAVENLKIMIGRGWLGRFGLFEAVEFTRERRLAARHATVVRSFMAHHQGMSLLSLCNVLFDNRMQRRFHADPMVAATELMLQERIPTLDEPMELYPELSPAEQPVT